MAEEDHQNVEDAESEVPEVVYVRTAVVQMRPYGRKRVTAIIVAPEGAEEEGVDLIPSETAMVGQFWDGENFIEPEPVRFAIVKNGEVRGIIMEDPDFAIHVVEAVRSDDAKIGQWYDGETFFEPPPPERYAQVKDGVVVNVIMAREGLEFPGYEIIRSDTAKIGDLYEDGVFTTPEPIPVDPPPPVPSIVASGNFTVTDGQVENLSVVSGLPAACAVDTGTYWVFFSEVQPDTSYIVNPSCSDGRVNVKARYEDFFEICVKDDGGALIDPSELSVSIVRTQ